MNPRRKSRLNLLLGMLAGVALTVTLILYALSSNIDLFYTPREMLLGKGELHELPHVGQRLRIGGLVMPGSVRRDAQTLKVTFKIYDAVGAIAVSYDGILPDLFREGQGVVAQGVLGDGNLVQAKEVLAKHDENYTPPEVKEDMKGPSVISSGGSRSGGSSFTGASASGKTGLTPVGEKPTQPGGFLSSGLPGTSSAGASGRGLQGTYNAGTTGPGLNIAQTKVAP